MKKTRRVTTGKTWVKPKKTEFFIGMSAAADCTVGEADSYYCSIGTNNTSMGCTYGCSNSTACSPGGYPGGSCSWGSTAGSCGTGSTVM